MTRKHHMKKYKSDNIYTVNLIVISKVGIAWRRGSRARTQQHHATREQHYTTYTCATQRPACVTAERRRHLITCNVILIYINSINVRKSI